MSTHVTDRGPNGETLDFSSPGVIESGTRIALKPEWGFQWIYDSTGPLAGEWVAIRRGIPPVGERAVFSMPPTFRHVYTCEQFAAEILCGNRSDKWVQLECKAKRIKSVAVRPFLIPQSEAIRFVCPPDTRTR